MTFPQVRAGFLGGDPMPIHIRIRVKPGHPGPPEMSPGTGVTCGNASQPLASFGTVAQESWQSFGNRSSSVDGLRDPSPAAVVTSVMTDDDGRNEPIKVTPGFVMDWFMADRIEPELEGMSEAKAEFTRGVTELVLKHLAAYMRESEFVVYGPSLARIEEKRAAAGGDPE